MLTVDGVGNMTAAGVRNIGFVGSITSKAMTRAAPALSTDAETRTGAAAATREGAVISTRIWLTASRVGRSSTRSPTAGVPPTSSDSPSNAIGDPAAPVPVNGTAAPLSSLRSDHAVPCHSSS